MEAVTWSFWLGIPYRFFHNVKCRLESPLKFLWSSLVPLFINVCIRLYRLAGFRHNKVPPTVYTDSFPAQTSAPLQIINQQLPLSGTQHHPSSKQMFYLLRNRREVSYFYYQKNFTLFFKQLSLCIHT